MAGLLKVKWLCAANCIAAGHLALGYFYLVVAADSCSVKIVMAGYVPRYRERALKYGKLIVGGQTHIFAGGSNGRSHTGE